jgi:hypothetical protein
LQVRDIFGIVSEDTMESRMEDEIARIREENAALANDLEHVMTRREWVRRVRAHADRVELTLNTDAALGRIMSEAA